MANVWKIFDSNRDQRITDCQRKGAQIPMYIAMLVGLLVTITLLQKHPK